MKTQNVRSAECQWTETDWLTDSLPVASLLVRFHVAPFKLCHCYLSAFLPDNDCVIVTKVTTRSTFASFCCWSRTTSVRCPKNWKSARCSTPSTRTTAASSTSTSSSRPSRSLECRCQTPTSATCWGRLTFRERAYSTKVRLLFLLWTWVAGFTKKSYDSFVSHNIELFCTRQPSLAACSWTHQVQVAVLVYKVLHGCAPARSPTLPSRPSKSPRTSLFLQRLPRSASGSPLHCWQPSICGGWLSGVELPATEGYVGVISVSLPHSTRDISVHWVISWHSAHLTFFVSTHTVCSGPIAVF